MATAKRTGTGKDSAVGATPPRQGLDELLETERRIAARIAAARKKAAEIVAGAQAETEQAELALAQQIEAQVDRVEAAVGAACDRAKKQIAADARERVETYERVSEGQVAELVEYVVERVIVGDTGGPDHGEAREQ